jgi:hypothetical protein
MQKNKSNISLTIGKWVSTTKGNPWMALIKQAFDICMNTHFLALVGVSVGAPIIPKCPRDFRPNLDIFQSHPRQSVVHIREVDYFVSPRLGVWLYSYQRTYQIKADWLCSVHWPLFVNSDALGRAGSLHCIFLGPRWGTFRPIIILNDLNMNIARVRARVAVREWRASEIDLKAYPQPMVDKDPPLDCKQWTRYKDNSHSRMFRLLLVFFPLFLTRLVNQVQIQAYW